MRFILFVFGLCLLGCTYTRKAATNDLSKIDINYQEMLAKYCGDRYPVITTTDSTGYKEGKRIIDSLAEQIRVDSLISQDEIKELWAEIERIRNIVHPDPGQPNFDSLCEPIYRLAASEKRRADKLAAINFQLTKAASNLKPVIDTVENTARLDECRILKDKSIANEADERKLKEKFQAKAKNRGIIMWALILLVIGAAGYKAYTMFRPKLK